MARKIAVVGTGTIGSGWAACFLARGQDVCAFDSNSESLARLPEAIARAWPALKELDPSTPDAVPDFTIASSLEEAVAEADFVQESGPENESLKIDLFAAIDLAAPETAIIASSSSSFLVSRLQSRCAHPQRCLVGHPFNPPYLIPLVEIVAGPMTAPSAVYESEVIYKSMGKYPLVLSREVPGYIANRLQNAVFREAMHLVQTGAASVKDIDAAMRFGPGLRWAFMGPFLTYALGGGHGGMRRYFEIFAEEITTSWSDLGNPTLSEDLIEEVIAQTDRLFSKRGVEEIMRGRDTALLSVAKATSRIDLTA